MKVRTQVRHSKRYPRVTYETDAPPITQNVAFVDINTGKQIWDYSKTGWNYANQARAPYPNCAKGGFRLYDKARRYCWIIYMIQKFYDIKYEYYTGHKYSQTQLMQRKAGNCCDLARLVSRIATIDYGNTTAGNGSNGNPIVGTDNRYCKVRMVYKGEEYQHVYNELYYNGRWFIFDAVSLLTGGNPKTPFGSILGVLARIGNAYNPCD